MSMILSVLLWSITGNYGQLPAGQGKARHNTARQGHGQILRRAGQGRSKAGKETGQEQRQGQGCAVLGYAGLGRAGQGRGRGRRARDSSRDRTGKRGNDRWRSIEGKVIDAGQCKGMIDDRLWYNV